MQIISFKNRKITWRILFFAWHDWFLKKTFFINKIKNFFLDILFPIECLGCNQEKFWLCEKCLEALTLKKEQFCPSCEKIITPGGRTCFKCRRDSNLDSLWVSVSYENKLAVKAVHYFKYRFVADLSTPLGEVLKKGYFLSGIPLPDLIVPVPLHKSRLRWRGFNQSELLACHLGKSLAPGFEIPIFNNLLFRQRATRPQMEIKNRTQRKRNVFNTFKITSSFSKKILFNRHVLLVDDIATTGATLFECARVLKKNGAREVHAVVIARQETKPKNRVKNQFFG